MRLIQTNRFAAILLLMGGLGMTAPACSAASGDTTSAANIKQETVELLEALKAYSVEQRDKAVEQASAALDNLDHRIEVLEADMLEQWDKMDQATRAKTQASLQALRQQRTRVAEWYGSMKTGSANAWGQIKQGFSSAYESLNEAWESSEREISGEDKK